MSDLKRKITRAFDFWTRLLSGIAVVLFLAVVVVSVPKWQVQRDLRADRISWSDVPQQENEYRKTLIQIAGGVVVAIGLYLTWRRIQATEESQVTDRFSKAIEQLGDYSLEVRLGGIYALERIAEDSPRDHWTVMETLSAFVRENASSSGEAKEGTETAEEPKTPAAPATDVQAACTVIARRRADQDPDKSLNLVRVSLSGANLKDAALSRALLLGADLSRALLPDADLSDAILEDADLSRAFLKGADLSEANLKDADLSDAILDGADLSRAFLEGADLSGATLQDADLSRALVLNADLSEANLQGADLWVTPLDGTDLSGADLRDANLSAAILSEADLSEAKLQGT